MTNDLLYFKPLMRLTLCLTMVGVPVLMWQERPGTSCWAVLPFLRDRSSWRWAFSYHWCIKVLFYRWQTPSALLKYLAKLTMPRVPPHIMPTAAFGALVSSLLHHWYMAMTILGRTIYVREIQKWECFKFLAVFWRTSLLTAT